MSKYLSNFKNQGQAHLNFESHPTNNDLSKPEYQNLPDYLSLEDYDEQQEIVQQYLEARLPKKESE